jgi:hypothetical protein
VRSRSVTLAMAAILVGFAIYAALFIAQTSFVVEGARYFVLFDDAMVSMRYAAHLAHGVGLAWNPAGDPVEGYSNPLWMLYMAAWHLLPLPPETMSLAIQLSGAAALLLNLYVVFRMGLRFFGGAAVAVSSALLTAFYLPLNNWSLQGMEVGVLTLLVSAAVYGALDGLATGRGWPAVYALLGLGVLVRLDMLVLFVAMAAFLVVADQRRRGSHLAYGLAALLLSLAPQTAFRLWYFGDPLPNTYYLKMVGYPPLPRMLRGLHVFVTFMQSANLLLFAAPAALALLRRRREVLLLAWVFCTQAAYSIYVGGDAWEWWGGANRYVSPVMPAFFILLCYSLWLYLTEVRLPVAARLVDLALLVALLVAHAIANVWGFYGASLLPWMVGTVAAWLAMRLVIKLAGRGKEPGPAAPPRYAPHAMAVLVVLALLNVNAIHPGSIIGELPLLARPLHTKENAEFVNRARVIEQITTPQAGIAITWAGIVPYLVERQYVDLLGKNDGLIAREPMKELPLYPGQDRFFPGHMKWDYNYSIGARQPDVVVDLWPPLGTSAPPEFQAVLSDAHRYLDADYTTVQLRGFTFYLRKGSAYIRWDAVGQ